MRKALDAEVDSDGYVYFVDVTLKPLMFTAAKSSLTMKSGRQIYEAGTLFRIIPTTLLEVFCKILLYFLKL